MWFPNRSDTNQAVQAQKMAQRLEIFYIEKRVINYYTICVAKTKVLISFAVTELHLCFHIRKCWFSHDVAHIIIAEEEFSQKRIML